MKISKCSMAPKIASYLQQSLQSHPGRTRWAEDAWVSLTCWAAAVFWWKHDCVLEHLLTEIFSFTCSYNCNVSWSKDTIRVKANTDDSIRRFVTTSKMEQHTETYRTKLGGQNHLVSLHCTKKPSTPTFSYSQMASRTRRKQKTFKW